MCGFSLITYTECGHETISTTAQNTRLCNYAKMFHLVQGIDCAPAACVPSVDTETLIVTKHKIFGHCSDCRANLEVHRGENDHVQQIHATIKPHTIDEYDKQDLSELKDLRAFIEETTLTGMKIAESFEALLPVTINAIQHIEQSDFRALLAKPGPYKYNELYLTALTECSNWLPILEAYIEQRAPNKLFADAMLFVFDKAEKASIIIYRFRELARCLYEFQPSLPARSFNGSEVQLEHFVHLLLSIRRGTPDTPPNGFYLYEENARISFNTMLTFRVREAMRQACIDRPIPRAGQVYSRFKAGEVNKKGLSVEVYGGLLPDEPAVDIEVEHIPISAQQDAEMMDSEALSPSEETGQRLFQGMPLETDVEDEDHDGLPSTSRTPERPAEQIPDTGSLQIPSSTPPTPPNPPSLFPTAPPLEPDLPRPCPEFHFDFTPYHQHAAQPPTNNNSNNSITTSFTSLYVSSPLHTSALSPSSFSPPENNSDNDNGNDTTQYALPTVSASQNASMAGDTEIITSAVGVPRGEKRKREQDDQQEDMGKGRAYGFLNSADEESARNEQGDELGMENGGGGVLDAGAADVCYKERDEEGEEDEWGEEEAYDVDDEDEDDDDDFTISSNRSSFLSSAARSALLPPSPTPMPEPELGLASSPVLALVPQRSSEGRQVVKKARLMDSGIDG